jgi:hypothetical protein
MTTAKLRNSTGNSVNISGGKSVTRYNQFGTLIGIPRNPQQETA